MHNKTYITVTGDERRTSRRSIYCQNFKVVGNNSPFSDIIDNIIIIKVIFSTDLDLTVDSLRYEEIISMMSEPLRVDEDEIPPPIPPKGLGHISSIDSGHHENGESHC